MKATLPIALFATVSTSASAYQVLPTGIWTTVEDVYFADEEGRTGAEIVALEVESDGNWRFIDMFGQVDSEWRSGPIPDLAYADSKNWMIGASELRRARPFSCWVSVRKFAAKPDGSADWTFANNLPMFDQGGRIAVLGKGVAPDVELRMRNVTWAKGSRQKPSLVIYIHKDDPERAESYSWTSPDARLVGINLRWVQASCSPKEDAS